MLGTPKPIYYSEGVPLVYRRQCGRAAARLVSKASRGRQMTGRSFALMLAAAVVATMVATPVPAQDYPVRPVRIIVPFGAGGPADVTARQIGSIMQENFGQPFVVENRT